MSVEHLSVYDPQVIEVFVGALARTKEQFGAYPGVWGRNEDIQVSLGATNPPNIGEKRTENYNKAEANLMIPRPGHNIFDEPEFKLTRHRYKGEADGSAVVTIFEDEFRLYVAEGCPDDGKMQEVNVRKARIERSPPKDNRGWDKKIEFPYGTEETRLITTPEQLNEFFQRALTKTALGRVE